jgi:NAD(P)-dependent dehydrogenase (short-subunit alcohol dehydrogenase family)
MTTIAGKVALITGATSGIGLAAAHRLLAQGAHVVIAGREGERLRLAAESLGVRAEAIATDVSDPESIARLMARLKARQQRLDILVINAGVSDAPEIDQLTPMAYDALMDINCKGATFSFVHARPLLADGASVVFTGSVAGRKGQPGDALYAGSKGFIRAFARTLGTDPELLRRRIRVNVVTPGPIDTPLTHAATSNKEVSAYVENMVPMGRWGRAEEVAEAILFLASAASSFTTGAELTVDGGMSHA